jgi:Uma2 family endonuclease
MLEAPTMVSVEEYLNTSYEDGDREYVDGQVVERNLGERDHSGVQGELVLFFGALRKTVGCYALPEQRIRVAPTRYRIPDVSVYIGGLPEEPVFTTPPFLVIEILSKDDRASDVLDKIEDYRAFGVPHIWVVDPRTRRGWVYTPTTGSDAQEKLWTRNPDIELPPKDLF